MPAKNIVKQYIENGYYHLYNRGVEKRKIFLDKQDYSVFLNYLKEYLSPKNEKELREKLADEMSGIERDKILKKLRMNNFNGEVTLLAYCLMPNHFHLFVKQRSANSINKFIQSLCTRYTMYFNRKYKRLGPLFQSTYKAVDITSENQFLHLSRYIHRQALQGYTLEKQPCSYGEYLGLRKTEWIKPGVVLEYFSKNNPNLSYASFVRQEEDAYFLLRIKIEED